MSWFARNHMGRLPTRREEVFLAALTDLLSGVKPAQIDAGETALAAEGDDCLIVLMPHRGLGGIAIVVWLTSSEGTVTLAQVGGLDTDHDSLDLGVRVSSTALNSSEPNFAPLLERIREQLFAPLTIRSYGESWATVSVRDSRGVLRRVGFLGDALGWFRRLVRLKPTHERQIRFVDSEPPPTSEASSVDEWFGLDPGAS